MFRGDRRQSLSLEGSCSTGLFWIRRSGGGCELLLILWLRETVRCERGRKLPRLYLLPLLATRHWLRKRDIDERNLLCHPGDRLPRGIRCFYLPIVPILLPKFDGRGRGGAVQPEFPLRLLYPLRL